MSSPYLVERSIPFRLGRPTNGLPPHLKDKYGYLYCEEACAWHCINAGFVFCWVRTLPSQACQAIALVPLGSVVRSSLRKRYGGSAGATPKWLHPGPLRIKHNWPARVQQRPATPVPVRHVAECQQVSTVNRGCMHTAPPHFIDGVPFLPSGVERWADS